MSILDNAPSKDEEIKKRYKEYVDKNPQAVSRLRMIGFGEILAVRCIDHFGLDNVVRVIIQENPYSIMKLDGISFGWADKIAKVLGIDDEDPRRQHALITKVIEDNTSFGHVYLPISVLERELKKQRIKDYNKKIEEMAMDGEVVIDDNRIYLDKYWSIELEVTKMVLEKLL